MDADERAELEAATDRLLEWVEAWVKTLPDGASTDDVFDEELAAFLGVATREPVLETVSTVPGWPIVTGRAFAWDLLRHAADELLFARCCEEDGFDLDYAARGASSHGWPSATRCAARRPRSSSSIKARGAASASCS